MENETIVRVIPKQALYAILGGLVQARITCTERENQEWFEKHTESIEALVKEHMPSGSGFDTGTHIDFDASTPERLVFVTSFHHMDDNGGYTHWTDHIVRVKPSLAHGITITISGPDNRRTQWKQFAYDTFYQVLKEEVAR
jgi:hypothetical protein